MTPAKGVHVLTASVALDIASEPFAFYGIHMKHTVEPGEFEIIAGNSSRDADLQKAILTVTK
jgi:beta-glucosidase